MQSICLHIIIQYHYVNCIYDYLKGHEIKIKLILSKLISKGQICFYSRRLISNEIIVMHEVINSINSKGCWKLLCCKETITNHYKPYHMGYKIWLNKKIMGGLIEWLLIVNSKGWFGTTKLIINAWNSKVKYYTIIRSFRRIDDYGYTYIGNMRITNP